MQSFILRFRLSRSCGWSPLKAFCQAFFGGRTLLNPPKGPMPEGFNWYGRKV